MEGLTRVVGLVTEAAIPTRIPDGINVTDEAVRRMVQTLLAERFKLRSRFESETHTVSILKRVRGDRLGPNLKARPEACARGLQSDARQTTEAPLAKCSVSMINGHLTGSVENMSSFAQFLAGFVRQVILDETELRGSYDVEMTFDQDTFTPLPRPPSGPPSSLPRFTDALRDSLGLKIETESRSVSKLVTEQVEPPTEN